MPTTIPSFASFVNQEEKQKTAKPKKVPTFSDFLQQSKKTTESPLKMTSPAFSFQREPSSSKFDFGEPKNFYGKSRVQAQEELRNAGIVPATNDDDLRKQYLEYGQKKLAEPLVPFSKMPFGQKVEKAAEVIGSHPFDFMEKVLSGVHELFFKAAGDIANADEEQKTAWKQDIIKRLGDPKVGDEDKAQLRDVLRALERDDSSDSIFNRRVIAQAALTTAADWETYSAVFKPLEWTGSLTKNIPSMQKALRALNGAIGLNMSVGQIQSGVQEWKQGHYADAISDFGGGAAMAVLPFLHEYQLHQDKKKAVSAEELRKATADSMEKLAAAQEELRKATADSMEKLAAAQEQLKNRNIDAKFPVDPQEIRKLAENVKNGEPLSLVIKRPGGVQPLSKAEGEAKIARIEAPIPEKKPFEEEPVIVRGRQPMTREERDQQWLDERKAQIQKEIEEGKKLRADVFARSFDEAREARERALREGKGIRVIGRRGAATEEPPTTVRAMEPSPGAPEAPGGEKQPSTERLKDIETSARLQNMELEKQKSNAAPDEYEKILKNQEDNRDLVEKAIQERQAAEAAIQGRKKPKAREAGKEVEGVSGNSTTLKTVTRNVPARYKVVEAASLKPSHNPTTFEPEKGYPEGVQERDYHNDKDAQVAVIQHAQNYDPDFTISDAPGPEHGPPMTTPDGVVLGGNSRVMSTVRLYDAGEGDAYKSALQGKAQQFGIDPQKIAGMKQPILVREITEPPTNINDLRALGSDLNRVFTRKLSEYEQAVSAGKRITPETLDFVGQELTTLGEDASLRDLLRERPRQLLERFEADGIIAPTERRAFMDEKTGTLNDVGKDFIENSLLGAVVDDPNVLANAPKAILHKLERSLAPLARIRARDGAWDITDYLTESLREHIAAQTKGVSLEDYWNPPTAEMFPRPPVHPIVRGLAAELDKPSNEIKKDFEGYARDAEGDVKDQATMAFYVPPKPWDSFKDNFGVEINPADWGTTRPTGTPPKPEAEAETKAHVAEGEAGVPTPLGEIPSFEVEQTREAVARALEGHNSIEDAEAYLEGFEDRDDDEVAAYDAPGNPISFGEVKEAVRLAKSDDRLNPFKPQAAIDFRSQLKDAFPKLSDEQIDSTLALIDARARSAGMTRDAWLESRIAGVERGGAGKKGAVQFLDDNRAVIQAFESADVSTALHELAHIFRRDLSGKDRAVAEKWAGVKDGDWKKSNEEKFARGFERYLYEGKAPEKSLVGVFDRFKNWLKNVYQAVTGSQISIKLTPEIRGVFDRLLVSPEEMGPPPEVGISPEAIEKMTAPVSDAARVEGLKAETAALEDRLASGKGSPEERRKAERRIAENKEMMKEFGERRQGTRRETPTAPHPAELRLSIEEPPSRLSMAESIKSMSDSDLRTARDSIQSQLGRRGLGAAARENLQAQIDPFEKEIKRRGLTDKESKSYGSHNIVFTKERHDAALQRIRGKMGRLHAGIDPEILRDVAEVMAYHFEAGVHSFVDLAHAAMDEMGKHFGPYMKPAYDMMIRRGKDEVQRRLFTTLPEDQRRQLSNQLNLFERKLPEVMGLEKPPAEVEVEREKPKAVVQREPAHERLRPEERPRVGEASPEAPERRVVSTKPATGRGVRTSGEVRKPGGIVEAPAPTIRVVKPPVIEAEPLEIVGSSVDPEEWKKELRASSLSENLPPPTEELSPEVDSKLIFRGQPEIVRTALTSLRRYGAAVISTATGSGKTYSGAAILAELKPNWGVIITPSQPVLRKWMDVAAGFGVDVKTMPKNEPPTEPGVYIETYRGAQGRGWLKDFKWDVLLADESHYARRWYDSSRGQMLLDLSKNSSKAAFISATPFHNALELGYLDKLGLWKKSGRDVWLNREFGVRFDPDTGKPIVPHNPRKLAALRDELINRGMMVNLDRNMDGYSVNFSVVPLSGENQQQVRNIVQGFKLAEDYFKRNRSPKLMAARGNAATFMKSYLERSRLNEAIDMGKRLEKEGWKVIYFTENKSEVNEIYDFLKEPDAYFGGEISRLIPKLPGVVESLKGSFGEDVANFTGADSPSRAAELEAFMSGDKKHMIATYGAGGVGVDMHDTAGDAPRAAIYLGPPWSGVMFDQAVGRPWRFGTKSNVAAYVLTSNAGPEMKLVFQKVLPRFESLKAAVSGIKKTDPIVKAMRDLDSFLDYEAGNDTATNLSDFLQTVQTNAVTSYKEAPITSAEDAKGKGMKVERRFLLDKPPGELSTLYQEEIPEPPDDLPEEPDERQSNAASSAEATRRMFVPEKASKNISDPRILDRLDDNNRKAVGLPTEENKPPAPPGEVIGNRQVPRPGEATVRTLDLGAPKIMARIREFQVNHFKGFGLPDSVIKPLAEIETAARLGLAKWHTASYILSQFKETSGIARAMTDAEMRERRQVADMRYTYQHDIMGKFYANDIAERKIDEALRRTDQTGNTMELLGEKSKWVDGSEFTREELAAAQRVRNEIYEPIIQMVRQVRPDVGYRRKYSTVLRTIEDLSSTLYPELHGKVPADLFSQFSLEIQQSMTKDPFSPYTLERKGTPPKAFNISDIMDAYIPSMIRVAHYTPMARRLGVLINRLPESRLKDYTKRYARIFFGVPDEYKHLQGAIYRGSRHIINTTYAAALELNPYWFVMHLSKTAVNTFPELGKDSFKYLVAGANASTTEAGREILGRSGILLDTLWSHPDAMLGPAKELKRHPSNWMRLTTSLSDAIDRGIAYLGALEKAKDLGMLGDKEKVGDITWERLNELASNGVDVEKALDFAYSSAARSQFMYTPAHLGIISREHPFLFQFKHYFIREAEFISNMRKMAKEAKAQNADGYTFAMQKAAEGKYEYIDAVAKYHRLLMALTGAAATAFGIGGQLFGRLWPLHMAALLSPGVAWADQTFELVHLTMQNNMSQKQLEDRWKKWFYRTLGLFVPGSGFIIRTATAAPAKTKKKSNMEFTPPPGGKFQLQSTPQ